MYNKYPISISVKWKVQKEAWRFYSYLQSPAQCRFPFLSKFIIRNSNPVVTPNSISELIEYACHVYIHINYVKYSTGSRGISGSTLLSLTHSPSMILSEKYFPRQRAYSLHSQEKQFLSHRVLEALRGVQNLIPDEERDINSIRMCPMTWTSLYFWKCTLFFISYMLQHVWTSSRCWHLVNTDTSTSISCFLSNLNKRY
jgi:hypothetical protein